MKDSVLDRSGLNPKTIKNIYTSAHAPSKSTVTALAEAFSAELSIEFSEEDIKKFLLTQSLSNSRDCGPWEYLFKLLSLLCRIYGIKRDFTYSKGIIVPLERSAFKYSKLLTAGETQEAISVFLSPPNDIFLKGPIRLNNVLNSFYLEDIALSLESEILRRFWSVYIRQHLSGISALEAEKNILKNQGLKSTVSKYMPKIKSGKIEGPVSRYLTWLIREAGLKNDSFLAEKIFEKHGGDPENWRRLILKWRKTEVKINSKKRRNLPTWKSIARVVSALNLPDKSNSLYLSYGHAVFFQEVVECVLKYSNGKISDNDIVDVFSEYDDWYKTHLEKIRQVKGK